MFDNDEIKEKVMELHDLEPKQIAKTLNINLNETNYYLKELRKEGKIRNRLTERKEENMENTRRLYNAGMSTKQIADKLNVTRPTVINYLNKLEKEGKIIRRIEEDGRGLKGSIKKRENKEKTKKMYDAGISIEEIAMKLELSTQTINRYINELGYVLEPQDNKDGLEIEEEIKEVLKRTKYNKKASKKFTEYMLKCKKRLQENNLDSGEIETIEKVTERTNKYAHILFCIKANMHFGKTQRARFWVNSNLNNEMLTEEQRKSLKNVRDKIDLIVKTRDARRALKDGKSVREAAQYSGLKETEVAELKNKLEAKDKDKENGDSTDEGR